MNGWNEIMCCYCGKEGHRSDIHQGGWILAKGRMGCYVCTDCVPLDNAKDRRITAHLGAEQ
ncbi:hypothetical protein [Frateuria sp.]|uniref:hypothetical protein n=1 Tax=Frateuria sp. TaxID=2211372 RepID=UPI003F7D47AD